MVTTIRKIEFAGHSEAKLAARLDVPEGPVRAYALFAHCFTCSKDIIAARHIASELASAGIAVLRFDFTGLGSSQGEFANTGFSSNGGDLVAAAGWLRENFEAPAILIGHSLGGAAVLSVAARIPEVKAVVTIAAPADADHVLKGFEGSLDEIQSRGKANVKLAGRSFSISRKFVEDVEAATVRAAVAELRRPLLILHAPLDETVGIENATALFQAARHPKSFISLDNADHLLSKPEDAKFAAAVIAGWASRYLPDETLPKNGEEKSGVVVTETGQGKFQNKVQIGKHHLLADEPASYGGMDSGPSPYEYLSAALGACTTMTLRMYADRKKMELGKITVHVNHTRIHARDCMDCSEEEKASGMRIDQFERMIAVKGGVSPQIQEKLVEIADKCPVHRTLEHGARVVTGIDATS